VWARHPCYQLYPLHALSSSHRDMPVWVYRADRQCCQMVVLKSLSCLKQCTQAHQHKTYASYKKTRGNTKRVKTKTTSQTRKPTWTKPWPRHEMNHRLVTVRSTIWTCTEPWKKDMFGDTPNEDITAKSQDSHEIVTRLSWDCHKTNDVTNWVYKPWFSDRTGRPFSESSCETSHELVCL